MTIREAIAALEQELEREDKLSPLPSGSLHVSIDINVHCVEDVEPWLPWIGDSSFSCTSMGTTWYTNTYATDIVRRTVYASLTERSDND